MFCLPEGGGLDVGEAGVGQAEGGQERQLGEGAGGQHRDLANKNNSY